MKSGITRRGVLSRLGAAAASGFLGMGAKQASAAIGAQTAAAPPRVLALIGDRYGWIPPEERMRAAAQEAGFTGDLAGKSITALEIEFGVLDSPGQRRRSRFYFREPLPYDQMDPDTAAVYSDEHSREPGAREAHDRLQALKARIEREMLDRVRRYQAAWDAEHRRVTGLEAWGQQVLEDLWHDLDEETRQYLHLPPATWQDQERWALEQFIETQCRDFIGRQETIKTLLNLATSPTADGQTWGACVTGASGSGKSSLFAELHRLLREKEETVRILLRIAGQSIQSVLYLVGAVHAAFSQCRRHSRQGASGICTGIGYRAVADLAGDNRRPQVTFG